MLHNSEHEWTLVRIWTNNNNINVNRKNKPDTEYDSNLELKIKKT